MSVYTQLDLLRRSALFTNHGLNPEVQAVIAAAGITPEEIACGAAKIQALQTAEANKTHHEAQKRKAIQAEKIAREAVQNEISSLIETLQTFFPTHEAVSPNGNGHASNGHSGPGQVSHSPAPSPSRIEPQSKIETLASWRALLNGTSQLSPAEQAQMALAGWPPARIAAAHALVEGYAKAENDQRVATYFAQAAREMQKTTLKDLNAWYLKAQRMSRTALQQSDPQTIHRLNTLLGLE